MIAVIPKRNLSVKGIKLLRSLTSQSIEAIRNAAKNHQPLESYEAFRSDWDEVKYKLVTLAQQYDEAFFFIYEIEGDEHQLLSFENFLDYLKELRCIELEQQRNSDLECGLISVESDFHEHDENWYNKAFKSDS
ncbi:hypothetical protein [Vibrio parahaemolyticus]|uniref:hypothetical protein n=1 Tax=Vibrio parahaemolyticus TaxID=670 RepID=UPI00389251D1|nr:hypothetical protein [Vibrio parahaemolyticus]